MADVRKLQEVSPSVDAGLVEMLRDLLAMAERGEVLGLALAADLRGRETLHAWSNPQGSVSSLVTGLERAKLALLAIE